MPGNCNIRPKVLRAILAGAADDLDGPLPTVTGALGEGVAELRAWDPVLLVHDYVLRAARDTGRRSLDVAQVLRAFGKIVPSAAVRDAVEYWAKQGFWKVAARQEGFRGQWPAGSPLEIELPERVWVDRREVEERMLLVDALQKNNGQVASAARALGLAPEAARYRMRKHGIAVRKNGGRVTVEFEDRLPDTAYQIRLLTKDDILDALVDSQNNVADAARALGYSYGGLLGVLHRYGVQRLPSPPGTPAKYRDSHEPARELLLAGGDLDRAARSLGISREALKYWLKSTPEGRATPTLRQFPDRDEHLRALRYHLQSVSEGGRFDVPKGRILQALFDAGGEATVAARALNLDLRTIQRLMAGHAIRSQKEVTGVGFTPGTVSPEVKKAYLDYLKGELAAEGVTVEVESARLRRSPQLKNRLDLRQAVRELLRQGGSLIPTARALLNTNNTRSLERYLRWEKVPVRSDFPDQKSFLAALRARARELGVDLEPVAGPGATRRKDFTPKQLTTAVIEHHGHLGNAASHLDLNSRKELRNLLRLHGVPVPAGGQDRYVYLRSLRSHADRLGVPRSRTDPHMAGPLPVPMPEIFRAMLGSGGRVRDAAQVLGIDHKVLLKTLQRLQVPTPGQKPLGPEGRSGYLESLVRRGVEMGQPEAELRGHIAPPAVPIPRAKLLEALVQAKGNITRAAAELGVTFGTVARWMKAYQIPTYQAHTAEMPVGGRQEAYHGELARLLDDEKAPDEKKPETTAMTTTDDPRRLARLILARVAHVNLRDSSRRCRTVAELRSLIRGDVIRPARRSASVGPEKMPRPSPDAAAGRRLSDEINQALGTEDDWFDLVRRSLPISPRSPDHGELATHVLEDILIHALRHRQGLHLQGADQLHPLDVEALARDPEGAVRQFVQAQWRPGRDAPPNVGPALSEWQRGRRERNFNVVDQGGRRPYQEQEHVVDPRGSEHQDSYDSARWGAFKREYADLLGSGTTDRRIAQAAVKIFEIRVRNAEQITRGGTSAMVQVRTDSSSAEQSAQEAARLIAAPADREWAELARSPLVGLTAAEVPRLVRYVHGVAGAFAGRHRGERIAELIHRLFPPAYFEALEEALASGPAGAPARLPENFDPGRARRLILQVGPEKAARQLGITPAELRAWWASERQVRAV